MLNIRVIPYLLLKNKGLVKGIKFKKHRYVGDPINAIKIFNEKEVSELIFLDIEATKENRIIPLEIVQMVADECYVPFTVGGGIRKIEDIRNLLNAGADKVSINTAAVENPKFIEKAAKIFGKQCIIVSIDVKKKLFGGYEVYTHSGTKPTGLDPVEHAKNMERAGAGELLITSIDRDGTGKGYDVKLIQEIYDSVNIPIIACGGANSINDFISVIKIGVSAVAAGSFFVFYGPNKAVLINFPDKKVIQKLSNYKS